MRSNDCFVHLGLRQVYTHVYVRQRVQVTQEIDGGYSKDQAVFTASTKTNALQAYSTSCTLAAVTVPQVSLHANDKGNCLFGTQTKYSVMFISD